MAETARIRPGEVRNPRPLILAMCFIWGIIMGFSINFFRTPETPFTQQPARQEQEAGSLRPPMSELERRHQDTPNIAQVEPAPQTARTQRPTLENVDVPAPALLLTTEGGLTGKTASQPGARSPQSGLSPSTRPPVPRTPPPLPDLMP